MASTKKVEFRTIDGLLLRGVLYEAMEKGVGVVLSPGFNCVKEMQGQAELGLAFQAAGITALVYDPRTTGESDGEPRNHIQPYKQVEDISDALSYLASLPKVDSHRMGVWGISLGGAASLCAASFDKRAKFVIAICPAIEYRYDENKIEKVLAKCVQDRDSQSKGNPPFYILMLNAAGVNPAGFEFGIDKEKAAQFAQSSIQLAPGFVNRTTIQSYHQLLMWTPGPMWKNIGRTPVMFVTPELDQLCPAEIQKQHFEALSGPKRMILEPDCGHMDILDARRFMGLANAQIDFVTDVFDGKFEMS